ncbi:unnamed protein product [Didymodactylos carnosus]|uniref:Uncharacterized protein n=1 Tax=Didymodactylos carnosus TaxID=1234261 RepID=A0A814ITL0_9BILA|nr:unnamed protein product [Didymodactylos carnosus]CAF1374956.1 unnamed protein product [Didymodactylos carnosus]CAF3799631.1 unnamed protein product [Didymodactylos carnosus]CAF4183871.1 unnamed protein product [Didymodactylos carnosus]
MRVNTSHKWSKIFLFNDYNEFVSDGRGGKQTDTFYDTYPEIEQSAKAFVIGACSEKAASFIAADLAQYIDEQYYATEIRTLNLPYENFGD